MRFAKLRLAGFKSFAEPAELVIRDGLTGVVGPNGCGKSNILEALRWVMGEGSARSLRAGVGGGGMDDVIFAGTARRARRDMAEVRLVLDNRAHRAPAAFNGEAQLELVRGIRRGEGSSYAVNGREVRLKDVQLLFADAATGAHSPALVGQGRVAAIIAAKPQERRQLLEEAAGIAGLFVRRREAEQRLRAADANLARLDDLLQARETQAAQLRRQAKAAARYRQLSEAIRTREAQLLRLEWQAAVEAAQEAGQALHEIDGLLAEHVAAAARAATAQANAAAELPARREAEQTVAATLRRVGEERATLAAERVAALRQLRDQQAAIEAATADIGRERARARDAEQTKVRLVDELAAQQLARGQAQQELAPAIAMVDDAESATTLAERRLAAAVEAHAAQLAEARSRRAQAEEARGRLARLQAERQRLEGEMARLGTNGAAARLGGEIEAAGQVLAGIAARIDEAAARVAAAEGDGQAARRAIEVADRALGAAREEVQVLEAEAKALARLRPGKEASPARGARHSLDVDPGFEAAVAAALGDDADAALGHQDPPARHWQRIGAQPDDPALPPGAEPLRRRLRAAAELERRLAQVGVVDAPPTTAMIAALATGQSLVSASGWLWRWDGFVRPPGAGGSALAESLRQENRLREIEGRLRQPLERQQRAAGELGRQQEALAAAQAAERAARQARREAEGERERLAARLQGLRAAAAQAEARQAAMRASIERLTAEAEHAGVETERTAAAVAGLADASLLAEALSAARSAAGQARSALAERRVAAAAVRRNLDEAAARIGALGRELAEWEARDRDATATAAALRERLEQLSARHAAMVAEPDALAARLHRLDVDIAAAEQERQQAAEAILAAELALQALDREARAAEGRVADSREARATRAAAAAARSEKLAAVVQQAIERFGCQPAELEAAAASSAADIAATLDAMQRERARIGAVNLRADIELGEVEAELESSRHERAELETAVHRLRGSIGTLNREGRARLLAAFAEVDRHFRDLFTTLFAGGVAELQLVESDDPLESGLEIRAQPPGKKLQSLSLLSGGEQALTAIALVFALFRASPAPISVLDEVDAPLDDANVERFVRLLSHMAEATDTRFLVVTHNPVTMAAMHQLYGVTMHEPGVSQLVSVELREARRMVAEPEASLPA